MLGLDQKIFILFSEVRIRKGIENPTIGCFIPESHSDGHADDQE